MFVIYFTIQGIKVGSRAGTVDGRASHGRDAMNESELIMALIGYILGMLTAIRLLGSNRHG
jgi:hypothetical protein